MVMCLPKLRQKPFLWFGSKSHLGFEPIHTKYRHVWVAVHSSLLRIWILYLPPTVSGTWTRSWGLFKNSLNGPWSITRHLLPMQLNSYAVFVASSLMHCARITDSLHSCNEAEESCLHPKEQAEIRLSYATKWLRRGYLGNSARRIHQ